jgi:hypothetical protein
MWSSENKQPRHRLWVGRRGKDYETKRQLDTLGSWETLKAENQLNGTRISYKAFTAITDQMMAFLWVYVQYRGCIIQRFWGPCCFHLQGENGFKWTLEVKRKKEIWQLRRKLERGCEWPRSFKPFDVTKFLPPFQVSSYPEDGDSTFHRNTVILNNYMEQTPQWRRSYCTDVS